MQVVDTALVFLFIGFILGLGVCYWYMHKTGQATGNLTTAINSAVNFGTADLRKAVGDLSAKMDKALNTPAPTPPA